MSHCKDQFEQLCAYFIYRRLPKYREPANRGLPLSQLKSCRLALERLTLCPHKNAWSTFSMSKDEKARIGSQEGDIMGLCYGARDLWPCIVQIKDKCKKKLCKKCPDTCARLRGFLTFNLFLYSPVA